MATVVPVEVLAKVGGGVARGLEVRGEGLVLVVLDPVAGAAVLVVGVYVVVVDIQTWSCMIITKGIWLKMFAPIIEQ